MSKTAIDAKRTGAIFLVDPDKITRVTDPKHPLYDPRVNDPAPGWLVKAIQRKGYKKSQHVVLRKNGPLLELVDGRGRHAAVLEVNKLLEAEGQPTIKIPAVLEMAKSDVEAAETMLIATYLRRQDDVITTAEKVVDYMQKFGRSAEDASVIFRVTTKTVSTYETLVQLSEAVKNAVRKRRISAHEAVKAFKDMTREEQTQNLERVLETAPGGGRARDEEDEGEGEGDGEGSGGGGGRTKKPKVTSPIARLRKIARSEGAMEALSKRERVMIEWIFNKATMPDLMGAHPALAEELSKVKTTKKVKKAKAESNHAAPRVSGYVSRA